MYCIHQYTYDPYILHMYVHCVFGRQVGAAQIIVKNTLLHATANAYANIVCKYA